MKKVILSIISLFVFGVASAQVDSKTPAQQKPSEPMPQTDTTSTNAQLRNEADIKTMDAVKTDNHPKVTPPVNDTVKNNKKKRSSDQKSQQ